MARWEQVLDDLVRTRGSALVGYAYLLTGDRREAEDLVQDALVKAFTRSRTSADVENAEAYVRRAVLTTYVDGFRRRKRWAAVRHLVAPETTHDGLERASADRLDVRAALDALTPRQRACVVLRFYEDRTVPDIGHELGLSTGAVKRYLSDAARVLERRLGPVPDPFDTAETVPVTSPGAERRVR